MASAEKRIDDDVAKIDLYSILGVSHDVTEKAIVKAYRKKALKCHPDKNPDNPAAIEMFHTLSKALEILTDQAARFAYDKIQKAKKASELRRHELDSKRRKLRDDLETREKAAMNQDIRPTEGFNEKTAASRLQAEVERLRKEGSRLLQEEQERLEKEIKTGHIIVLDDEEDIDEPDFSPARLKMKWKAKKSDAGNGGYCKEFLQEVLIKHGDVNALLISAKKNGSAVVEFATVNGAQKAYEKEKGLPNNPLTFTWLSGQPIAGSAQIDTKKESAKPTSTTTISGNDSTGSTNTTFNSFPSSNNSNNVTGFSFNLGNSAATDNNSTDGSRQASGNVGDSSGVGEIDFESLVFMRMRQAQERKRLAEEIISVEEKEDKES